ncbi:SPOC like C-terminal domain-containing protein [Syncephalis pseudoplumigaleata]|uniref:SPOC like C-terminal domain-containing protein n=1 Tax=Syncephalis pseudoplumigaleata TaxID=1712513 RepID=A0A4P9Z2S8_9FUNG|nr:SPOC like C-terminal domain-containing protein [Syncephalis pseudoplumigaleata]|eukprot:RKP25780.1 SPOC like C-terminal domain-containing protein [Syncephalis pseudoplumigaleata]
MSTPWEFDADAVTAEGDASPSQRTSSFDGLERVHLWQGLEPLHVDQARQLERWMHGMALCKQDIHVQLFPIYPLDPWTTPTQAYKELLLDPFNACSYEYNDMPTVVDTSSEYDELLARLERHMTRKRVQARLPFRLTQYLVIGLRIFNLVYRRRKQTPKLVYHDRESSHRMQAQPQYVVQSTHEPVDKEELQYYYRLGGDKVQWALTVCDVDIKVVFTEEEWKAMTDFGQPGVRLLGFKSQESLKLHHTVLPPWFAYPDEEAYSGSITAFTALLRVLAERRKVAIARMVMWANSEPRLVALLPQLEVRDVHGQVEPPGFHVITLPFVDAVRQYPVPESTGASEGQVSLAKGIISQMAFKKSYQPQQFHNYALQCHYRRLQATALEEEEEAAPEPMFDDTLPKNELIHKVGDGD